MLKKDASNREWIETVLAQKKKYYYYAATSRGNSALVRNKGRKVMCKE